VGLVPEYFFSECWTLCAVAHPVQPDYTKNMKSEMTHETLARQKTKKCGS